MAKSPLSLPAIQIWAAAICLTLCLGADIWTALYRQSEFLTSLGFTALVAMAGFFGGSAIPKRPQGEKR